MTSMVGWMPPSSGGYEARSSSVSARLSGSACQAAIRRIWPSSSSMSMRHTIGHHRHRDLGQALDHLAVVDDLGEDLGGQEQEFVAAPGLEEFLDQLLAFGRLGRRVQQLAEVVADGIHELDDRRVPLTRVAAQHLDDPDAGAVVADREGVGALQPVLDQRRPL